ncbi:DUF2992 family protein, partial [Oscillospiraceae bacterium 42-9]
FRLHCLYCDFVDLAQPLLFFKQGLEDKGIGTKAQQALQLQREQSKVEKRARTKEQKEAEKERQYALRQEKKKAKHRGR